MLDPSSIIARIRNLIEEEAPSLIPNGSIVPAKISARDQADGRTIIAQDGVGVWGDASGGSADVSDANPIMDGVAAPGIDPEASRADHVHPTDTSRASDAELAALQSEVDAHEALTTSAHGGFYSVAGTDALIAGRASDAELATLQSEVDTHEALTTTAHGGIVASTDPRLTDSRAPSGAAGGVLGGTYPNPSFAADMATQAELDAVAAAKQPLDADLTTIAALDSGTSTGVMATEAAGWVKRTYAQIKTSLGLVKADVGLGSVDNTSDAAKPVSTAQQAALDLKSPITSPTFLTSAFAPTVAIAAGTNIATIGSVNTALGAYLTTAAATAGYQPLDADLTTIASLTATTDNILQSSSSAWASRTPAQVAATLPAASILNFDTQVRTSRMSDLTLPNAAVPMNSQKFTGLAAGSANGDSLRYEQLFKTGQVTLLGGLTSPDGVATSGTVGARTWFTTADGFVHETASNMAQLKSSYLRFGTTSALDWTMDRTAANEVTVGAGDVLKHDTAAEGSANTVSANTAYVDRAVGSVNMARPMARMSRVAAQAIVTATDTPITFDTENADTDGMVTLASQPTRLTFTTAGNYVVSGGIDMAANATGIRIAWIGHYNSAGSLIQRIGYDSEAATSAVSFSSSISDVIVAAAGDYLQLRVYQTSGGNLNVTPTNYTPFGAVLSAAWVGGTGAAWGNASARVSVPVTPLAASGNAVSWSALDYKSNAGMTSGGTPTRLTVTEPGLYNVSAWLQGNNVATGSYRFAAIVKNGSTVVAEGPIQPAHASYYARLNAQALADPAVAGDYYEVKVYHDIGASYTLIAAGNFSIERVGYQTNPSSPPSCRVYNSAVQSIPNGAHTALTFNSERHDNASMHDSSSNTSRLTAPIAGVYTIDGHVGIAAAAGTLREASIWLNGATRLAIQSFVNNSGVTPFFSVSTQYKLAAGDYVELRIYQDSGGAINSYQGANFSPEFGMTRIGDG